MNPVKRVEKLRTRYERSLAASEARGVAYHEAVLGLIDRSGPDLRQLADELGLLDRPAEQTLVARKPRPRRRRGVRAAGAVAAVLVLAALAVGALRLVHAPPFVSMVRVPHVLGMQETAAIQRLEAAGLHARVLHYRRSIPGRLSHRVLGVSHPVGTPPAGRRLAKGSTITLYVLVPRTPAKKAAHARD
ncbi:MAG TPA: PASTA domain-containing protein [Gaiellaceae bacterium]